MCSPTAKEISEHIRLLPRFLVAVVGHYVLVGGGAIIGTVLLFSPELYQGVRASGLWLSFVLLVMAMFLAWRDEYIKIGAFEERMKSTIQVSCGRAIHQSVVTELDGKTTWFRGKLDLIGQASVPDIEAHVIELLEDGKKVALQECLILTMYPGKASPQDKNLRTLYARTPEFVDIIQVTHDGKAVFPVKWYNRSVPYDTLLQPQHVYTIVVTLTSPSHLTIECAFEFDWTGDPNSSDIRLLDTTPGSTS